MKKIIVAPDSFKGTLEAREICKIVAKVIYGYIPDANIICIPMSDGGEGMVAFYLNMVGGQRIKERVMGPDGAQTVSEYAILEDCTAVLEMASCAGLSLMKGKLDPEHATTYGMGELLKRISQRGIKKVLTGIGGSATNDVGIGMAAALGYLFLDEKGEKVEPLMCNLEKIAQIKRPEKIPDLDITVACDVDNCLYGNGGATYTFGKQKGIREEHVEAVDRSVRHFAEVLKKDLHADVALVPGSGAGGGMGAAMIAFLGATLKPGMELLLDAIRFDEILKDADLVITGEGRIDWQSAAGKVPVGIARRARRAGIPCIALCGSVGVRAELAYDSGLSAIFSSVKDFSQQNMGKKEYEENIRFLTDSVIRTLMIGEGEDVGRKLSQSKRAKKVI